MVPIVMPLACDPERLAGAAIEREGAATIDECDITFDVWSQKNGCAASDLVPTPGSGYRVGAFCMMFQTTGCAETGRMA